MSDEIEIAADKLVRRIRLTSSHSHGVRVAKEILTSIANEQAAKHADCCVDREELVTFRKALEEIVSALDEVCQTENVGVYDKLIKKIRIFLQEKTT